MASKREIKDLIVRYRKILENFSYLTVLQIFNLFFPIIIYPFFIGLFGLELWGKIVLAQALAFYVSIFIDFGFDRYATREVSIHREDANKLSEISSCIVVLRLLLGIAVFIPFSIIVNGFSFFHGDELLYLLFFGVNFNFILFPKWFFQGIEQMNYIVIINVSVKILFVILMYIFIDDKADFLFVPLFFALGAFFGGLIGVVLLFSFPGITFKFYDLPRYFNYLRRSFLLFASSFVISIKDRFNVFIVGYFLGNQEVAIYDIGSKLVSLIMQPIDSINGAIYPKVSKELNMDFVKKVAFFSVLFVCVMILTTQVLLVDIFEFLNVKKIMFENSIRLFLISPIFLTLSVFLARNCFIVHDKFLLLFKSMVWTSFVYLALITILFITGRTSFDYLVLVVFLVYVFEFFYRYFVAKKNRLFTMKIREQVGRHYYNGGKFGVFLKPFMFFYDFWRHRVISDKRFIKNRFKRRMGYPLNLDKPITLNEKIQWLKLYDRTRLHTICADKIAVRDYVKELIGDKYLVPILKITKNIDEISPEKLPERPFIIKTNHDSGSYRIIKNKENVRNWEDLRSFFAKKLKTNYYYLSKEWQYKNIPPKILVESLLQTNQGEIPKDYKFHCFNGRPEYIQLDFDRGSEHHSRNWYDKDWNRANFHWAIKLRSGKETLPNDFEIPRPNSLNEMLQLAEKLSQPFSYARVDFYLVNDRVYFGEITFHHDSGFRPIVPFEWDRKLGKMVKLPKPRFHS